MAKKQMTKEQWMQAARKIVGEYLTRNDGCFDAEMHAKLVDCSFGKEKNAAAIMAADGHGQSNGESSISIEFETLQWQVNERGGIHGGAIAGMFDTAFGVVANFVSIAAGGNEAATADMHISYLRPVDFGQHTIVTVYVVKQGRSIIRLRAEMYCKESGKLVATGSGSWMPL